MVRTVQVRTNYKAMDFKVRGKYDLLEAVRICFEKNALKLAGLEINTVYVDGYQLQYDDYKMLPILGPYMAWMGRG